MADRTPTTLPQGDLGLLRASLAAHLRGPAAAVVIEQAG
jgi:hypothetical protein